jgi:hypothetical protein
MKTERYWMGVGMFTCFVMGIFIAVFGGWLTPRGVIDGTVTYRGRPVSGGMVVFASLDLRSDSGTARIDAKGHFVCPWWWKRDNAGESRFQIRLVPDPRLRSVAGPATSSKDSQSDRGPVVDDPARSAEREFTTRVLHTSMGTDATVSTRRLGELPGELPPSTAQLKVMEVLLGPESAHIDIDLGD